MEGSALIKGVHIVSVKRPGKPVLHYVYAYRGGPLIHKKVGGEKPKLGTAEVEAYREAMAAERIDSTTVSGFAAVWRSSPAWQGMAETTRAVWGPKLSVIEAKWGMVPLSVFGDRRVRDRVIAWRDSFSATPRTADYYVQVLSAFLAYGVERGRLSINVADGITGLYKGGNRAAIVWDALEREVLSDALDWQLDDAFKLACLTGLRRGDLVNVPLSAVWQHAIVWQTSKSGRERTVTVPLYPRLLAHIETLRTRQRAPGVDTLLVTTKGKPWSPGGLTGSFNRVRDAIGFDKHLHDARGTFVTELCLAGLTDEQVAGIVGWSPTRVAEIRRIYVDQARTVVAIGERLANANVKRPVKRPK